MIDRLNLATVLELKLLVGVAEPNSPILVLLPLLIFHLRVILVNGILRGDFSEDIVTLVFLISLNGCCCFILDLYFMI